MPDTKTSAATLEISPRSLRSHKQMNTFVEPTTMAAAELDASPRLSHFRKSQGDISLFQKQNLWMPQSPHRASYMSENCESIFSPRLCLENVLAQCLKAQ